MRPNVTPVPATPVLGALYAASAMGGGPVWRRSLGAIAAKTRSAARPRMTACTCIVPPQSGQTAQRQLHLPLTTTTPPHSWVVVVAEVQVAKVLVVRSLLGLIVVGAVDGVGNPPFAGSIGARSAFRAGCPRAGGKPPRWRSPLHRRYLACPQTGTVHSSPYYWCLFV